MNKRIFELAREAAGGMLSYDGEGEWRLREREAIIFAELLVKECLEQVRDEVQHEYDWKLADSVTKRVLQHFWS